MIIKKVAVTHNLSKENIITELREESAKLTREAAKLTKAADLLEGKEPVQRPAGKIVPISAANPISNKKRLGRGVVSETLLKYVKRLGPVSSSNIIGHLVKEVKTTEDSVRTALYRMKSLGKLHVNGDGNYMVASGKTKK